MYITFNKWIAGSSFMYFKKNRWRNVEDIFNCAGDFTVCKGKYTDTFTFLYSFYSNELEMFSTAKRGVIYQTIARIYSVFSRAKIYCLEILIWNIWPNEYFQWKYSNDLHWCWCSKFSSYNPSSLQICHGTEALELEFKIDLFKSKLLNITNFIRSNRLELHTTWTFLTHKVSCNLLKGSSTKWWIWYGLYLKLMMLKNKHNI